MKFFRSRGDKRRWSRRLVDEETRAFVIEAALSAGDADALVFTSADVLDRVQRLGDLFSPLLDLEQELPALSGAT